MQVCILQCFLIKYFKHTQNTKISIRNLLVSIIYFNNGQVLLNTTPMHWINLKQITDLIGYFYRTKYHLMSGTKRKTSHNFHSNIYTYINTHTHKFTFVPGCHLWIPFTAHERKVCQMLSSCVHLLLIRTRCKIFAANHGDSYDSILMTIRFVWGTQTCQQKQVSRLEQRRKSINLWINHAVVRENTGAENEVYTCGLLAFPFSL